MGACCSKNEKSKGSMEHYEEVIDEHDYKIVEGDYGARVRLQGSCRFVSMYTRRGRKGINQDAMTVWEDFTGEKDKIFCGVFDGHGPLGHKVASLVRDVLPSKISSALKPSGLDDVDVDVNGDRHNNNDASGIGRSNNNDCHPSFSSWEASFIKAFKEMDEELSLDSSIDCFCSGTTAVTLLKQGEDLVITNLGDSRAVLCTRDDKNQPIPVQLTVDLKPNLPSESERIKNCKGRVFAMDEEPGVFRVWLPDENCPGLAMARAFGDFCLKDFGLISIPQVSYRKLTNRDEFLVLATDGVWDVLSNKEVIKIVASARRRSLAAKLLVAHAIRAWTCRYPTSKVDDCAVICLFLKPTPLLKRSISDNSGANRSMRSAASFGSVTSKMSNYSKAEWCALEGVSRANTIVKLPRFSSSMNRRRRFAKEEEDEAY